MIPHPNYSVKMDASQATLARARYLICYAIWKLQDLEACYESD